MKKLVLAILLASATAVFYDHFCSGEDGKPGDSKAALDPIALPAPDLTGGRSLMQALKDRRSDREYAETALSSRHLSEILWASDGVNREDGKRTAPSAMNKNLVDVYAITSEGVYVYVPARHVLAPLAAGDHRAAAGPQPFVQKAPLNLVYVADFDRFGNMPRQAKDEDKLAWACIEAGHQAQNVCLYCASEGLSTVVRGMIDKEKFAQIAKLGPNQKVVYAQTVGYSRN